MRPGPSLRLSNGESVALLSEEICSRHTDVEINLAMPFRRMMVHDRDVADDGEPVRLKGHDDHRITPMRLVPLVRRGAAHDYRGRVRDSYRHPARWLS